MVGRYYTEKGVRDLRANLRNIYIEIGNTFQDELLEELNTLMLFNVEENVERADSGRKIHKYKITAKDFSLDRVFYSSKPGSEQQVIANFFRLLDENLYHQCSLEANSKLISKSDFDRLLKKYFMLGKTPEEKNGVTYAQYTFWLKIMKYLIHEFEKIQDLHPDNLLREQRPQVIRTEIAEEINLFASNIINLSVQQAKDSQKRTKVLVDNLKQKEDAKKERMDDYQKKFSLLEPWNSANMLVPLISNKKILFAHTNFDLFNLKGSMRFRKRINLKSYIRKMNTYVDHEKYFDCSDYYLKNLAEFLGKDLAKLKEATRRFKGGKGFCITKDNYMKICLIILKAELKTPIIMMGESGCGKTYVSQFVSSVLMEEELRELTLYAGVTEKDFVIFMRDAIIRANEIKAINKRLWIFFDEFNTSCLQSIVAEIMLDRICSIDLSIYKIPDNIVFISCCNPYRMKTKKAEVGLVPKTTDTLLSHRVYPIPERLINFIWDFGQLSDEDEYKHLVSIIVAEKIFSDEESDDMKRFSNMIYTCHKYVRDIEERSGVSLRDIKRVLMIYKWFEKVLTFYEREYLQKKKINKKLIRLNASVSAIMVCYGLRLNGKKEQEKFMINLRDSTNLASSLTNFFKADIKNMLSMIASYYFQDLLKEKKQAIIPEDIALNKPLMENFITMLSCFDTLTPLIICGAPGTSKTLCTQIFNSALTPNIITTRKLFSMFKGINAMYYGGSQTSTSEGIAKVFKRGEKYLENKGEDRPVVVFDEIGLAELSPHNPLKILHPLLERVDVEVGFIGLSNWTLDLSKMNRLIYVARPDMTQDDLKEIFKISVAKCSNNKIKDDLITYLQDLTCAYLKFREWQKKYGYHANFHGSRDIYGVSKFIYHNMVKIKHYDTSSKAIELVKKAIERNFGGAIYLFGKEKLGCINSATIENLDEGFPNKELISMIRIKEFGDIYTYGEDKLQDILNTKDETIETEKVRIYSSSEIFKKLFCNEMVQRGVDASQFYGQLLPESSVISMINQNINDKACRFLLIKSEGEVVDNIFIEKLKDFNKSDKIIDWRGIKGRENSIELLSTLKSYISLGYVVVMKNLDELYGSLYDLFNQKYMEIDGRQYCYLYYGENKHRVEVHPDFKSIVILSAENELEGITAELEQPAPFLNRFEKFFLRISNILEPKKIKELVLLRTEIKKYTQSYTSRLIGMSIDMITSI